MSERTTDPNADAPTKGFWTTRNSLLCMCAIGGLFMAYSYTHWTPGAPEQKTTDSSSQQTVKIGRAQDPKQEPAPASASPATPTVPAADPVANNDPGTPTATVDPLQSASFLAPVGTPPAPAPVAASSASSSSSKPDALPQAVAFRQSPLPGVQAVELPDPYLTVYPNTPIQLACDAMDTEHPGPVSCHVNRDVKAYRGSAVLIPRGSRLTGKVAGQLVRGQKTMSVVASYIITSDEHPRLVQLDSDPMLDSQGRAGLPAHIDNKLWPRLEAGTYLTLIDGAFSLGQSALSKVGSTNLTLNTSSSQSAAETAFQADMNIPPVASLDPGTNAIIETSTIIAFPGYSLRALR